MTRSRLKFYMAVFAFCAGIYIAEGNWLALGFLIGVKVED